MLLCSFGCGDDSDSEPMAGTEAGGGAAGTTAGTSAGMGGGGTSGTAGSAGMDMTPEPPMPVPCGSNMCNPPTNPFSGISEMFGDMIPDVGGAFPSAEACCLDEGAGTCGLTSEGAACELPAEPDERCPSIDAGFLGMILGNVGFGCCVDNMCGVDGAQFGRGCIENSEAETQLGGQGLGMFLMVPGPRACDAPPADDASTGDEDAGI